MTDVLLMIATFAVIFVAGYLLISRVPQMLHTPLMSMTNALSAVTMLGAFLLFALDTSVAEKIMGVVAIAAALFNVVGGFIITDRMLKMFRRKQGDVDAFRTAASPSAAAENTQKPPQNT